MWVICTHVGYLRWAPNVTGEQILMPQPGIEPSPLDYKSRLVPQGSTSVSYTYTL